MNVTWTVGDTFAKLRCIIESATHIPYFLKKIEVVSPASASK
jgi:hypothetical protein